jgi:hypothetical protein
VKDLDITPAKLRTDLLSQLMMNFYYCGLSEGDNSLCFASKITKLSLREMATRQWNAMKRNPFLLRMHFMHLMDSRGNKEQQSGHLQTDKFVVSCIGI